MDKETDMKWQVLVAADEARRQGYMHTYHALLKVLAALDDTCDTTPSPLKSLRRTCDDVVG